MTSNWGNLINKRVGVYLSKIADEHLERILNKGNDIAVGTNAHIRVFETCGIKCELERHHKNTDFYIFKKEKQEAPAPESVTA